MNLSGSHDDMRQRTLPVALEAAARTHGARPFLRETTARDWISFADAFDTIRALAKGLGRHGVGPGDFIPLMLPNCPEFVLVWFAASWRGAAYVSVNTSLIGGLLGAQLGLARARLWVVHAEFLPVLEALPEALRQSVEALVVVGLASDAAPPRGFRHVVRFEDLLAETGADPAESVGFKDVAAVTFTSGTTGPSKGVMVPQGQVISTAMTFSDIVGLSGDDVLYTPLPLFHGLSSRMGMIPALLTGCRVVLGKRFSGSRFWTEAAEAEATVAHTIFSIPNVLLGQPPGPQDRAHRVTRMYNAHHSDAFQQRFGVDLVEAFGISEVGLFIASPILEQRPGSAGRAHPDWEVAVVDEDGLAVPADTPGEIICRPRLPGLMMRGYLNQPDRTVEATQDLWYHTGDIARRDADGYYWFLDRAKERIRRRGENISSLEIEECARGYAGIEDVAAVGHPARQGEDDIRLLIVAQSGAALSKPALHAWLAARLPRFMVPRYVEIVDALPYTATNKVEKGRLKAAGLTAGVWDSEASH